MEETKKRDRELFKKNVRNWASDYGLMVCYCDNLKDEDLENEN